jgi:hypothetical protein
MSLGSGIRDPGSGKNLFRIPDPEVKKAPDPGSRIRIRNTGFWLPSSVWIQVRIQIKLLMTKTEKKVRDAKNILFFHRKRFRVLHIKDFKAPLREAFSPPEKKKQLFKTSNFFCVHLFKGHSGLLNPGVDCGLGSPDPSKYGTRSTTWL